MTDIFRVELVRFRDGPAAEVYPGLAPADAPVVARRLFNGNYMALHEVRTVDEATGDVVGRIAPADRRQVLVLNGG